MIRNADTIPAEPDFDDGSSEFERLLESVKLKAPTHQTTYEQYKQWCLSKEKHLKCP